MRTFATVVAFLMFAGVATAQPSGSYTVTGRVVVPGSALQDDFEILLLNETERVVASVRARADEQFSFRGLPDGIYFLNVAAPGFREARQRVEFFGGDREGRETIFLEPERQVVTLNPSKGIGGPDVISVGELARSGKILKQFQDASKKLQAGDFKGAQMGLKAIVAEDPDFYEAHQSLGIAYQQSLQYSDAEKEYQRAHELNQTSAVPLVHMGSLYLEEAEAGIKDGLDNARVVLRRAVYLDAGDGFARYLLGVACLKSALFGEAENNLLRALELKPKFEDVRLALANLYIRTEDWAKAMTQLDAFLKENPRSANRERVAETRSRIAQALQVR